jgi:hypothetical protein
VGRICTICSHEDRYEIEDLLATRQASYRAIAIRYGVGKDACARHVGEGHVSSLLALAADAERAARADTLLDRIESLQRRTEAALDKAEQGDNLAHVFRGIAEMRHNLEVIGELTKELNRRPTFNLELNAEYVETRTIIVRALEAFPQARESVVKALEGASNGTH